MPPDSDAPIDAPKLRTILARAARSMEKVDLASIAATGLCLSDFAVLEVVLHKGPLPVNTIGPKVGLTSGSISTAVDRLQDRGLAKRVTDREDRPVTHVHLTPTGKRLIQKAYAEHAANLEDAMASLSTAEKKRLADLLKKLGLTIENKSASPET